jgi:acyl transferase domain-containing protein
VWPIEGFRRVSINCFGFGGTNAHIILDDALHYLSERNINGYHCSTDLSAPPSPSTTDSGIAFDFPSPDLESSSMVNMPQIYVLSSHEESGIDRLSAAYSQYLVGKMVELYPGVLRTL